MMQLARTNRVAAPAPARGSLVPSTSGQRRRLCVTRANDTNIIINLLASGAAGGLATAVTLITAEDTDGELARLQTVDGAIPLAAAVAADAVAHSIPGLNILFSLAAEPAGAAAGVAYMLALLLSAPSVDPTTLAPEGTLLNASKVSDVRAAVRVPFTQIVATAIKVVDLENDGSSGKGWQIGKDGLPRLPITSVAIVIGVGSLILEAASHAPVLSLFMPRVLQVAGWLAVAGFFLDKRSSSSDKPAAQ